MGLIPNKAGERRGGRKKGSLNRRTIAHREWADAKMNSVEYRENLWRRILRGHANHMELYLAETVFGPRKQQIEVSRGLDLIARVQAGRERLLRGETSS